MFARRGWMIGCFLGSIVVTSPLDARAPAAPALNRLLAEEEAGYRPARVALARAVAGWFFAIREVVAPRPRRLSADETVEPLRPRMRVLRVAVRRPQGEPAVGSESSSQPSAGGVEASSPTTRPEPAIRTPVRPRRVAERRADPAAPTTSPVPAGGLALGLGAHPVVGFDGKPPPLPVSSPRPPGKRWIPPSTPWPPSPTVASRPVARTGSSPSRSPATSTPCACG